MSSTLIPSYRSLDVHRLVAQALKRRDIRRCSARVSHRAVRRTEGLSLSAAHWRPVVAEMGEVPPPLQSSANIDANLSAKAINAAPPSADTPLAAMLSGKTDSAFYATIKLAHRLAQLLMTLKKIPQV